jgi:hypothetical protein
MKEFPTMPSPAAYNAALTDRDLSLLRGLFESRVMTLSQVASIHFDGNAETAKKRVQKLKAAGYLAERPRRAYDRSVLFLGKRAFAALEEGGHLTDYPALAWTNLEKRARVSDMTLRHELDVMEFKAAVYRAIAKLDGLSVAEFSTWPLLYEFQASPNEGPRTMAVRPDGFLRLHEREPRGDVSEHTFFLEVDRSTEVLDTLVTRARCYRDWYRRGGLAARHGRPHAEFEQFPFRVLVVVRNAERRNNLAERLLLLRPPILSQVWMTTFPEATTDPLGSIWVRPLDYREATADTAFAPSPLAPAGYRRNAERELAVEAAVKKSPLMTQPVTTIERADDLAPDVPA